MGEPWRMKEEYTEKDYTKNDGAEQEAYLLELQRLVCCYQIASRDDRNVVWAALNKYMPHMGL